MINGVVLVVGLIALTFMYMTGIRGDAFQLSALLYVSMLMLVNGPYRRRLRTGLRLATVACNAGYLTWAAFPSAWMGGQMLSYPLGVPPVVMLSARLSVFGVLALGGRSDPMR